MKRIICILIILYSQICIAQNLVPNPSFEDTVVCPDNYDECNYAVGWDSYRFSPDYFNSCNSNVVAVPLNDFGFQYARSGNAYAGFVSFQRSVFYRESLGAQLAQPLTIGQQYYVSFYVSMAARNIVQVNIATNKIGIKFSSIPYSTNSPISIDNSANIFSNNVINDTINWIKVAGSFIADSSYKYLSIGNFFTDSATSYTLNDVNAEFAYYYVDDVCVSTDSIICNGNTGIIRKVDYSFHIINNFSNGIIYYINNSNKYAEVIIYSSIGKLISTILLKDQKGIIDFTNYSSGTYLLIINHNGMVSHKKVIKY